MTIGKSLQSKRLEKKLSLTDVSHSLKIDEKTLQQIEADNFTGLSPVVVRSYIRQYASLLGLDGAKLLDAYTKAETPAMQQVPVQKVQQAAAPAAKKKTEAEIKLAKAQKAVANSHSVRGLKSIFNLFDKINLDKFLKYGIWVIMGLAVVGSVAKGFTTAASKISTNQSSSVSSSSSSQDKKQPPKKDDQPSSQDSQAAPDAQSSSSQADEASLSSSSAQNASSASSSSAEQSSSSSASSQSSQADEASSSSENATE